MNKLTLNEPAIGGFQLTEQEFGLDAMLLMKPYFCCENGRKAAYVCYAGMKAIAIALMTLKMMALMLFQIS